MNIKCLLIPFLLLTPLCADPIPYDGYGLGGGLNCNDGANAYGIVDTPCDLAAGFEITSSLLFEPVDQSYGWELDDPLAVEGQTVALNLATGEFFDPDLTMVRGIWIAISDEQAYSIRGKKS